MNFYGGDGDDIFNVDDEEATPGLVGSYTIEAGAGNDKINMLRSAVNGKVYG